MNLHGSITGLQNNIVGLYLKLEQRFKENKVISELWSAMASDVSQQVKSLNGLSAHFWRELKKDHAFSKEVSGIATRISKDSEDRSLQSCFENALTREEPVILKIYGPILRNLRENWNEQALDFYIVVKAHLARIARIIQAYSGDPLTLQRSNLLLQQFEKEVQAPQAVVAEKASRKRLVRERKPEPKSRIVLKRNRPLTQHVVKHAKAHRERSKPLVEKINLRRRRARR
jgi:hypothetical protein